jgi:hypothetical protein
MNIRSRILLFSMAAICTLFIFPHHTRAAGGSWVPSWSAELGIQPDTEPQMGQIVETIMATVVDSTRLTDLKFNKVKNGDRVKMDNLGSAWWSVKVGEKVYYPALWKVTVLSTKQVQALIPKRKKPYGPRLPAVEQKTVSVPGNQPWTGTGLTLQPQDRVTVTAKGNVFFSGGLSGSRTGPDGWNVETYEADWPDDYGWGFDPLPKENHAALIGKVGEAVFIIGEKKIFWHNLGDLYLGINDCSFTDDFHNTGQFNATITVEREIVPKP